MALPQGINLRLTTGHVTDGANDYGEIASSANFPTTTPQGNNVGWESGSSINARYNRNSANDPRLAGCFYMASWTEQNYRIDLPSAGYYKIRCALGDPSAPYNVSLQIVDNATVKRTVVSPVYTGAAGRFYDASGVERTSAADWVANNAEITETFASTILRFRIPVSGDLKTAAHFYVESASAPAAELASDATAQATATGALTTQIPINSASVVVATATGAISTSINLVANAVSAALATGWLHKAGGTLAELYDAMGDNVGGTVLQGNPTANWTQRANVGMGNKLRGDFAPNYWTPSNPAFKALVPWEAMTCWFVAWPGTGHTATNTGINVKRLEFWVQRESTGEWRLENASGTEIGWPSVGGAVNTRVEADGSRSFFLSGAKNSGYVSGTPYAVHGSVPRFALIDGDDIRCVYARLEYRLILEDPAGQNDMADSQIYVDIGADPWPTMSTVVGDYTPMTYAPQVFSSRFELASVAPRYVQAASINPPAQETGYPAGDRSIARATFESNLPPPLMPFAASAAAQATAAGEMTTGIQIAADASAQADAGADMTTGIPLEADAAAQSSASGALQSDAPELAANAAGQSTATADLTTTITLSGAAIAQALATAGIDTSILLSGGASAQSSASADMTTGIPLQADATAQATATADLGGAAQLSANAVSSATATGELTIQIQLSAAAVAQALATASLDGGPVELAGNAAGESSASAELTTQIQLDADAASVATATGQLMASDVPLAGNAIATATAAGDLSTQINLTSTALNVVSATGDLTVFLGISAHAAALALAGADLTTQIPLNTAAVAQALATANLTGGVSTIKPNPAYTVKGMWRDYRVAA